MIVVASLIVREEKVMCADRNAVATRRKPLG
jgi:hypothetical protein